MASEHWMVRVVGVHASRFFILTDLEGSWDPVLQKVKDGPTANLVLSVWDSALGKWITQF